MSEQLDKYLRKALKKVIDDIQKEIPDTDDNKMFIALLNTERRGIPYKAPEILSNVIQKIYDILIVYAPLENDATDIRKSPKGSGLELSGAPRSCQELSGAIRNCQEL